MCRKTDNNSVKELNLRWRNFFNHNTRYWLVTTKSICIAITCTISNPESNSDVAFGNKITVTFNMAMTMEIFTSCTFPHVENPINGHCFTTFSSIKCKIPTLTASVAVVNRKSAAVKDSQRCVVMFLFKNAILSKLNKYILSKFWSTSSTIKTLTHK